MTIDLVITDADTLDAHSFRTLKSLLLHERQEQSENYDRRVDRYTSIVAFAQLKKTVDGAPPPPTTGDNGAGSENPDSARIPACTSTDPTTRLCVRARWPRYRWGLTCQIPSLSSRICLTTWRLGGTSPQRASATQADLHPDVMSTTAGTHTIPAPTRGIFRRRP